MAEDFLFEVWRDGDWLHEQRIFPPGQPKQVTRETFRKKPYYWPAIKARLSESFLKLIKRRLMLYEKCLMKPLKK